MSRTSVTVYPSAGPATGPVRRGRHRVDGRVAGRRRVRERGLATQTRQAVLVRRAAEAMRGAAGGDRWADEAVSGARLDVSAGVVRTYQLGEVDGCEERKAKDETERVVHC